MTKDTALDLALEALEGMDILFSPLSRDCTQHNAVDRARKAIIAIKQALAQPAPECTRSHPHENMDAMCKLRTEIARLTNENARLKAQPATVQSAERGEPVAWKWHQAPVKTSWGHDMVVADLAIDKDHTVSVYCERDQTVKVVAMFTPPAAQRQWVGLTDEQIDQGLCRTPYAMKTAEAWREGVRWAYHQLKEKNT